MTYQDIIDFWFEEIKPDKWWLKDLKFDQLIHDKFVDIHQAANAGELYLWREQPLGRLAEIIILDQFSRNMFRDTPQAFSSDPLALILAQEAIKQETEQYLSAEQCSFLYLPFMHSESLNIHNKALELYQAHGNENNLAFEIKHRNIIEKFGRYPHRNEILGRTSTPDEIEFLKQPGSSF